MTSSTVFSTMREALASPSSVSAGAPKYAGMTKAARSILEKVADIFPDIGPNRHGGSTGWHGFHEGALEELGPGVGSMLGAGIGEYTGLGAVPGAALGYGVGSIPHMLLAKREAAAAKPSRWHGVGGSMVVDGAAGLGAVLGTGAAQALGYNPLLGTGLGMGTGAVIGSGIEHLMKHSAAKPAVVQVLNALPPSKGLRVKLGFATSEYSGDLGPGPMSYRNSQAMPGGVASAAVSTRQQMAPPRVKLGSATTPAGRLSHDKQVGAPKSSAAPGPSIRQVVGASALHGHARPGTTKATG
jgi:hypothetical protein